MNVDKFSLIMRTEDRLSRRAAIDAEQTGSNRLNAKPKLRILAYSPASTSGLTYVDVVNASVNEAGDVLLTPMKPFTLSDDVHELVQRDVALGADEGSHRHPGRRCPLCGTLIEVNFNFCPSCGQRIMS